MTLLVLALLVIVRAVEVWGLGVVMGEEGDRGGVLSRLGVEGGLICVEEEESIF